jgi:DNA-binding transcriptional MocR family regulator
MQREFQYLRLARKIEADINAGHYRAGGKLPSLRRMREKSGLSISTVQQAYMELENRGLVQAREKSGFYLRPQMGKILPPPARGKGPIKPHKVAINTLADMLQQSVGDSDMLPFGAAIPSPALLPHRQLAACMRSVTSHYQKGNLLGYGDPTGEPELRRQIAARAMPFSFIREGEEIIITNGCMHAIDLCLRTVARPGDIILVESPTFLCYLQLIEDLNMRVLEVPVDPRHGLDPGNIEKILAEHDVRAALFNPNFHNPLGCLMSERRKKKLVTMMNDQGVPIIEDDIYGDLFFDDTRPTPLKSYDRRGLVLYCSSFSKTLIPDLRVGWTMPGIYREKIKRLKFNVSIASPRFNQLVIAEFLAGGSYDRHLRKMRASLRKQTTDTALAVGRFFPDGTRISVPRGGYTLWVQLPDGVDSLDLCCRAAREKIAIFPGALCSGTNQYNSYVRLSCGHPLTGKMENGIRRLAELVGETGETRGRAALTGQPGQERSIRIGLNSDPETLRAEQLCGLLRKQAPDHDIFINYTMSGNIFKLLASQEMEGGFVFGDCPDERFVQLHLALKKLCVVGPVSMRQTLLRGSKEEIATLPWIGFPLECPYCRIMQYQFHEQGLYPDIRIRADQESAIGAMIRAGVGLSFMLAEDARQAEMRGELVIWPGEQYDLPLSFVTLAARRNEPRIRQLTGAVRTCWS